MTRSILSLNPVSSRFERADRSHARRSQATHGPTRARGPRYNGATRAVLRPPTVQTRARGPRYNGATRAVLRPPTVQRVLAVPATRTRAQDTDSEGAARPAIIARCPRPPPVE